MSAIDFSYTLKTIRFDENYVPAENTRLTTNFANLARGEARWENLQNTLRMIDNRFNSLATWDNAEGDRYTVEVDIVSVEVGIGAEGVQDTLPLIEMLQTTIFDTRRNERITGIVGNSFSSYVRDYDFSIRLQEYNRNNPQYAAPEDFGVLHGNLFKHFLKSDAYSQRFKKLPVICLSVSSNKTYHRTGNQHPILGIEYANEDFSSTDQYFAKMGMKVRYFMPKNGVAPLAFYHIGDLLADYTGLELIGTISTMETFQKIYRPEIYNANSPAAELYRPSLKYNDYSLTRIVYDREERSRLAVEQGLFVEERFITPYNTALQQWSANITL